MKTITLRVTDETLSSIKIPVVIWGGILKKFATLFVSGASLFVTGNTLVTTGKHYFIQNYKLKLFFTKEQRGRVG